MRHFATLTLPDGVYACTANPDGTIPLSSRAFARNDQIDRDGANLRRLIQQANFAGEMAPLLYDARRIIEKAAREESAYAATIERRLNVLLSAISAWEATQ